MISYPRPKNLGQNLKRLPRFAVVAPLQMDFNIDIAFRMDVLGDIPECRAKWYTRESEVRRPGLPIALSMGGRWWWWAGFGRFCSLHAVPAAK